MKNQQKTWDAIAKKWNKFREKISPTVEKFLKEQEGKILDVGCGSGRNFIKNKNQELHAIDFSNEMLKLAEKNAKKKKIEVKLKHSKASKLPFEDNYFNSVLCYATLHCLKKSESEKAIKEIHRVLKPKGQALISVWSRKSPRLRNQPKECFIPWTIQNRAEGKHKEERYTYIFDKEELEKLVKEAGFKILRSWQERNINLIVEKPKA